MDRAEIEAVRSDRYDHGNVLIIAYDTSTHLPLRIDLSSIEARLLAQKLTEEADRADVRKRNAEADE